MTRSTLRHPRVAGLAAAVVALAIVAAPRPVGATEPDLGHLPEPDLPNPPGPGAGAATDCFGVVLHPLSTLFVPPGGTMFEGTSGDDVIIGTDGADRIRGNGGDDIICGNQGDDYILGDEGADSIDGEGGEDFIDGYDGDDVLHGGSHDDTIAGDGDSDRIYGELGDDEIYCGFTGTNDDYASGGAGSDTNLENQCETWYS